jgi:hypothetical protein
MADVEWPLGMGFALADGFEETLPVLAERSTVDAGPAKQRRVSTAGPHVITLSYLLKTPERIWLVAFWKGSAAGGAVLFKWWHPVELEFWAARFLAGSPPAIRPYKPDWIASVTIEALRPW